MLIALVFAPSFGMATPPPEGCSSAARALAAPHVPHPLIQAQIDVHEKERQRIQMSMLPVDPLEVDRIARIGRAAVYGIGGIGGALTGAFTAPPGNFLNGMFVGGGTGFFGASAVTPGVIHVTYLAMWAHNAVTNFFKQREVDRLTRLIEGLKRI